MVSRFAKNRISVNFFKKLGRKKDDKHTDSSVSEDGKNGKNIKFFKRFGRKKGDEHIVSLVKLMTEKKYEEALKLHEPFHKEENPADWYTKGYLLGNLNKIEECIECYDKAISLDPEYVKAWYRKGHYLLKLKKFLESAKCFEKVMDIEEQNVDKGKREQWAGAAVYSLMVAYVSEYNRLVTEKQLTLRIKASTNLWKEKCYNFFMENKLIPESSQDSEFLENSIQNFDNLLNYLEPSLEAEYKVKFSKGFSFTRRVKLIVGGCIAITAIILIFRFIVFQQPIFSVEFLP